MPAAVGDILWQPGADRIASARVTDFRLRINDALGLEMADFEALRAWSVQDAAAFWGQVWRFCGVVGDGPGDTVLVDGDRMPGASWFPQARLNYAENMLRGPAEDEALVFRTEEGAIRRLTFGELRAEVARVAGGLVAAGVEPGDRVAGFLPNVPEAVIAMLATASLGAVWSSCSPDFGIQGVLDRFGQIEPAVLFATDGYTYGARRHDSLETVALLRRSLPSLKRVVIIPFLDPDCDLPDGAVAWNEFGAAHAGSGPAFERLPFDHPLFIMFSSGTTGLPKCMVHSAGGTLLQHLKEHQLHCDLGPRDRLF
jgi:acetoacetyl-CoA synthetase